ncbi:hypothetical protein KRR40_41555 [Niabella defluvii]|nr:hypothetical protein KRR40_41555 [Niabella sp. I65]
MVALIWLSSPFSVTTWDAELLLNSYKQARHRLAAQRLLTKQLKSVEKIPHIVSFYIVVIDCTG